MSKYESNALDLFRIAATVQVFAGHILTHFTPSGNVIIREIIYFVRGVPILFILCGFLAAKSLENRDAKKWIVERAFRILPAYWMCIIVNTIIIAFLYPVSPTLKEKIIYVGTQFLGLNFYTGDWLRGYGVGAPNGALWTITVQAQFFLMAPIIHRLMGRKPLKHWAICILGFASLSMVCNRLDGKIPEIIWKLLGVTVFPYLYFLLFGMMLWYFRNSIIPKAETYRFHFLAAYIAWKLIEIVFSFPHLLDGILYNTITTLLIGCIISAFGFRKKVRFKRDYTYGFYLYHVVFINIAVQLGQNSFYPFLSGILRICAIFAAAFIAAWLSNRFVEIPASRFLKERVSRNISS